MSSKSKLFKFKNMTGEISVLIDCIVSISDSGDSNAMCYIVTTNGSEDYYTSSEPYDVLVARWERALSTNGAPQHAAEAQNSSYNTAIPKCTCGKAAISHRCKECEDYVQGELNCL